MEASGMSKDPQQCVLTADQFDKFCLEGFSVAQIGGDGYAHILKKIVDHFNQMEENENG
jgi:hypothetical protein